MCRSKTITNGIKYEMKRIEIIAGQKFNMLTIIEELPNDSNGRAFSCSCDCGVIKRVLLTHLRRGLIKSCGCHRRKMATTHGMWESREYSSWENMIQRCTNPKARKYHLYGGRGITVCDSWLRSFENFYLDLGPRPDNTTLDRIDGNEGYCKENCKWSNAREQLVNVRFFHQLIKHDGVMKTIEEWISEKSVDRELFKSRVLRGLSFKEALFCDMDIVSLNILNKQYIIYTLSEFLVVTGFEKEKVLELLDFDHEEPYFGYILRYMKDFNDKRI
jgi:hypothetical protein